MAQSLSVSVKFDVVLLKFYFFKIPDRASYQMIKEE